jgi:acyl-CoA thioesterase-1
VIRGLHQTTLATLAGLFLVLLAACDRVPQLPRLGNGDAIVAFGDSLTYGTGTSEDHAYPATLSRMINRTVINAGLPGETTGEGLDRLPHVMDEFHPKLVLLCLGGNDMLKRQSATQTESNLRAIIQAIRASGANVILIGVPEPRLFSGPPDYYETLAKEFGVPYESEVFNTVLKDNRLKSDPVHANAEGYRIVAEQVAQLLKRTGALP